MRFLLLCLITSNLMASGTWMYGSAYPDGSSIRGSVLKYQQKNPTEKTESLYLRTEAGIQFILSLFWMPIPFQRELPLQVKIGNGSTQTVQGTLLKGGHKIVLPTTTSMEIAKALSLNKTVTFSFQSFETTVTPDGFQQGWSRFRHY